VTSAARDRQWLFLERVPGRLLWQVGRLESWEKAARWLAALHTEFDADRLGSRRKPLPSLLRYDAAFYRVWLQRADENLSRQRVPGPPATFRRFLRLAGRYDRVVERLMGLPTAFTHGEFYPSNVIVRNTGDTRRICPIDWELAALAPGLIDLGALASGDWSPEDQRRLVAAYRESWQPAGGGRLSLADLREAVAGCQLHRAVQFLGWGDDWSPPALHARDWLREACRLADGLGL
jgi:aminoglycoside/choline kinase family phosphotransferase